MRVLTITTDVFAVSVPHAVINEVFSRVCTERTPRRPDRLSV